MPNHLRLHSVPLNHEKNKDGKLSWANLTITLRIPIGDDVECTCNVDSDSVQNPASCRDYCEMGWI